MLEKIKELIAEHEADQEEIDDWMEDDFNPMDASGGNFDDCYFMGVEHGETQGALKILRGLLRELEAK
jgi:hypothetical protein